MTDELFNQADLNHDQRLDLDEFRNFLAANLGGRARHSYESPSSMSYGDTRSVRENYAADLTSQEATFDSYASASPVNEANYNSQTLSNMDIERSTSSDVGMTGFEDNASGGFEISSGIGEVSLSSTYQPHRIQQQQIGQSIDNPQGLYLDPNPEIIRRPAQGTGLTYTQNIQVRFLQPPPLPPPGPLIIREVRPPQPPPPPPLRVRQEAPELPQLPPLILRERPPPEPPGVEPQTIVRNLPALPVPPRSVIIERFPPAPAKPRDIIIERWLPYESITKRKTIIQRAEKAKQYPKPRNIIIQYEPISIRVKREFTHLGVTQEDPYAYIQRYGTSLLDGQALIQQARAAGVVEDISPPSGFTSEVSRTSPDLGMRVNNRAVSSTSFDSSHQIEQNTSPTFSGSESAQNFGLTGGFSSSSYGFNAFATRSNASPSNYERFQSPIDENLDPALIAFHAADLNQDGALDEKEFRQFLSSQFQF